MNQSIKFGKNAIPIGKNKVAVKSIEKTSVCVRCGGIGHATENCTNEIPVIETLKKDIEARTRDAVANAPPEWKEDEFGLFLPAEPRIIDATKSWKDGQFCFNCGCFGHNAEECQEPPFSKVHELFSPLLSDNSNKATLEKQHLIDAINKFCDEPQN